jgi:hypothetical protein
MRQIWGLKLGVNQQPQHMLSGGVTSYRSTNLPETATSRLLPKHYVEAVSNGSPFYLHLLSGNVKCLTRFEITSSTILQKELSETRLLHSCYLLDSDLQSHLFCVTFILQSEVNKKDQQRQIM